MDDLQREVYLLLKQFVARQQIPFQMMRKHRRDFDFSQYLPIGDEYIEVKPLGAWEQDDEWDYFLHGAGCKVTHKISGEVIQWDARALNHFDVRWFVEWLVWRIKNQPDDSSALIRNVLTENPNPYVFRKEVADILETLEQSGKVQRIGETRYALVE